MLACSMDLLCLLTDEIARCRRGVSFVMTITLMPGAPMYPVVALSTPNKGTILPYLATSSGRTCYPAGLAGAGLQGAVPWRPWRPWRGRGGAGRPKERSVIIRASIV